MKWYLSLSIHQRINLKALISEIFKVEFSALVSILGFKETMDVIYQKFKLEGLDI